MRLPQCSRQCVRPRMLHGSSMFLRPLESPEHLSVRYGDAVQSQHGSEVVERGAKRLRIIREPADGIAGSAA